MQISRNVSRREKIDHIYAHYKDDVHNTLDLRKRGPTEPELNLSYLGDTDLEDYLTDTSTDGNASDNDSIDLETRNGAAEVSTKVIMATSQNGATTIQNFLATHEGDPAVKVGLFK